MEFDELQIVWNQADSKPQYQLNEEAMFRIVTKDRENFHSMISNRDLREAGIGVILFFVFLGFGIARSVEEGIHSLETLSMYVSAIGVAFVVSYLLITRSRQARREKEFDTDTVKGTLLRLHSNVSFQARLLKGVAWWYLLPLVPGLVLFNISGAIEYGTNMFDDMLIPVGIFLFVLWLNLHCVKTYLTPKKIELEDFLEKLSDGEPAE